MVVDVGEDQLVHARAGQIAEIRRMSRTRAAIAKHWHRRKSLYQRRERGASGLVCRVARLCNDTGDGA
jgi:hypothetical protein